jgi:hypothetical protein
MTQDQFIEKWNVGYEDFEQKAEFAQDMKNDLASLKLAEGSQWVKCSKRLPETIDDVLVLFVDDIVQAYLDDGWWKASSSVTNSMQDGYVADRRICKVGSHFDFVTHWMPLPAPPTK